MPVKTILTCCCIGMLLHCTTAHGQSLDSATGKVIHFPSGVLDKITREASDMDKQVTKQTAKYLAKMAASDDRLNKKLSRMDGAVDSGTKASATVFAGQMQQRYTSLLQKLRSDSSAVAGMQHGEYLPYQDSLQGMLRFLKTNPQSVAGVQPAQVQNALSQVQQLQARLQSAGEIQQFVQQRQAQMKQLLSQYTSLPSSIANEYNAYNKQLYYYADQVKSYKETLNDPDKRTRLALTLLDKVPAFNSFIKSNSVLAGLFNLPGTYNPSSAGVGLQTRDQVLAAFQNQAGTQVGGSDPSSFIQQNTQDAQGQVDELRSKLSSYGSSNGADIDMPDFHPNSQKTKSFLKRLEYGFNFQTVSSSYFFPATTDLGLSLGYKLNDKNSIGIGASYKIGWGKDISHIQVTSQGMGLRSYIDINIKKSFFATGGFEYNYQQPLQLADFPQLKDWQKSGLLGISKIVSLKTKVFKKTKIQLLWDFLSYEQLPKGQPFKFRVGYNF